LHMLYAWLALAGLSTLYVAWDNFVLPNREKTVMKWGGHPAEVKQLAGEIVAAHNARSMSWSPTPWEHGYSDMGGHGRSGGRARPTTSGCRSR
jgi:hypothetical protein